MRTWWSLHCKDSCWSCLVKIYVFGCCGCDGGGSSSKWIEDGQVVVWLVGVVSVICQSASVVVPGMEKTLSMEKWREQGVVMVSMVNATLTVLYTLPSLSKLTPKEETIV